LKAPWPGATNLPSGLTCPGALGQPLSGDLPAGDCAGATSVPCQGGWGLGVSAQTAAKTTTADSIIIAIVPRHEPASTSSFVTTY